eukprot:6293321-Lingulodinium_polyedra.AAC.1
MSASINSHTWKCRGKTQALVFTNARAMRARHRKNSGLYGHARTQAEDTNNLDRRAPMREWRH